MTRTWTIGSGEDCDLVVDRPGVSGRHCRLARDHAGGLTLEDLGSTNGTSVAGVRISGAVPIRPGAPVTLGRSSRMPWPAELSDRPTVLSLGRDPENDVVIDLPMISGRHARLAWDPRLGEATIEDLGSANGTFVGASGPRVRRSPFRAEDLVSFGSHALTGEWLLRRLGVPAARVPATDAGGAFRPFALAGNPIWAISKSRPVATVAANAVIAGLMIAGLVGALVEGAGPRAASLAFWLGSAAVWFGLSSAVLDGLGRPSWPGLTGRGREQATPARMAALGLAIAGQCGVAWLVATLGLGRMAPAGPAIGLMVLAAWAGAALGAVLLAMEPRPVVIGLVAPAAMALMVAVGGTTEVPRAAAETIPTRWAYEGLLLAGVEERPGDLAEPYFSTGAGRTGIRGCAIALAMTAAGLAASAAFIARGPGAPRIGSPPPEPSAG